MFYLSFFNNFLPSLVFLLINFIFAIQLNNFIKKSLTKLLNEFNIFVILISFYLILLSFLNLLNLYHIAKFIIYIIIIIKILLIYNFKKYANFQTLNFFFKDNGIYNYFILLFFALSILPLSDADSIATHLSVSKNLYNTGSLNFDENLNIENILYFGNEILLQLSFLFKSDNFGSQLNFFSLILFLISFKKNKDFKTIIFSIPLIIFLITTQKLQLFFGLIFLSVFIIFYEEKIDKKTDVFIFLYLLLFYCTGKLNYVVFGLIIFIFFCFKNKKFLKNIFLFSPINFLLFLFPILIFKYIHLGNPIAPFFDQLFLNRESFIAFETSMRSSEGWYNNVNIIDIFKPFFPTNMYALSSGFGLIFIFLLTDISKQKKLYFIPWIIVLSILLNGQLLPRYYLEAFLILAYYIKLKNITKYLCNIQSLFVLFFGLIFVCISYYKIISNDFKKDDYQKKFTYSYLNSKNLNKLDFKVLGLSLDRGSIYYNDHIYTMRLINILNLKQNEKYSIIVKFLEKNGINHLIHNNSNFVSDCIKATKVDEIYLKVAIRNFLKNENPKKYIVSKILKIKDECR